MQTEIEAKFLEINHDELRIKLNKIGAKLEHPMRLMRRVMLDHEDGRYQRNQAERLRIRDEANKVTVTYKKANETNYPFEVETTVGSFDVTLQLFKAIGFRAYSFQESKRETWVYKGVEIVLDEWPWLDTYIEVEGKSEDAIKSVITELDLDWKNACFGSVDTAYMHKYPGMKETESIGDLEEVRFDLPCPDWLLQRKR